MDRATDLIERVLINPGSHDVGHLANELLSEYYDGSDISTLRDLLHSEDGRIVAFGIWIAAELAQVAKTLLPDVMRLLRHPLKDVRFLAIDCVLLWAGRSSGDVVASTVTLLDDPEEAVRWKAMGFLARAPHDQLQAAVASLTHANPASPYLEDLKWILAVEGADADEITFALHGPSAVRRKVAAAAAVRVVRNNSEPLRQAESSRDPEVAQFARDMLECISVV